MNEFNFDRSIDIGNNTYVALFNELLQRFTPRDRETFQIILSSGVLDDGTFGISSVSAKVLCSRANGEEKAVKEKDAATEEII